MSTDHPPFPPRPDATEPLLERVAEIWTGLEGSDPARLASATGAEFTRTGPTSGVFRLEVWGREAEVTFPGFASAWSEGGPVDPASAGLLAYYFANSDGTPETGHLIDFGELRDATFYVQAFHGYTGHELAKVFGNDADAFAAAAVALDGRRLMLADRSFSFRALPLVPVAAACWLGDEDFGPSYRILFDAAVVHHLPTGVCAILGSGLTRRLITARG
ncbi:MAG TPA: DUF3786 domain-containing protein [Gemmatimonadales bacterium]|nr:DUF3786 domain-containing protein [Gemmatimonadales bacterium]